MMESPSSSSMILSLESLDLGGRNSGNPNIGPSQTSTQQNRNTFEGPVAILWDIENCPIPSDVRPEDVAGNIRMALRVHPIIRGAVTLFSAYGDFNAFPRRLREGCQRTGVKLVDVPNGRKDAADKAILVDMFLFALDNRPPSSILLISGDVDFSPALHILGQRGYTVILVIPANVGVSSALSNAGRFVWDWPSIARGEGFVPPKILMSRGSSENAGYFLGGSGNHTNDNSDGQNEEEAIVYRGANFSQTNSYSMDYSRTSQSFSEYNNNLSMPCFPTSRALSVPSGLSEVSTGPISGDRNEEPILWVQPGDINGLKGQMVKVLEISGGTLPLVRLPAEYHRLFGRPLYMAEYGVMKLVHLLNKMTDLMTVDGKGHKKFVYLRNSLGRPTKIGTSSPISLLKRDKKRKGAQENLEGSSDEYSDDDRCDQSDERLKQFRQEMQELLVSCSWKILLGTFEEVYKQRYKKALDYRSFGVDSLEDLVSKVRDVVVMREEGESKRKFLLPTSIGD
ncbi:hypothetical protein GIB67_000769 [Kingdonia uniflora]|uniref:HTH OST-type domain-containing protein n=1 Tax=Kingdonia uniflora TaxID=39325 RepID=A0A7J7NDE2_9MAGN|nr:hypothetical protein GIB67_000769 [Kingdonia uniflora]